MQRALGPQPIEHLEDGGLLYSADAAGKLEIKSWVLGFGTGATLLEAEWLRREIADEVEAMRHTYRST